MSELGRKSIGAASWAVVARLFRTLAGLVTLGVLSRYLTPADFGIAALILFVTSFSTIFADFGTRVALVQRKEITRIQELCVFWSNSVLGGGVAVLLFIFADPVSALMGNPHMADPLRWITPLFLMGGLQGVPLAMLERRAAFGLIARAEIFGTILGSVVAISMAVMGFRIGALIAQQLVVMAVTMVSYVVFSRWRPAFGFDWGEFKPLLGYGGYVTGAGLVQMLSDQIDRPIIGTRLSAADLGYLSMSQQIAATPLRVIGQMVRKVMFPIMSTIQDDDDRMARGMMEIQYGLALVMAPVCLGLWALSEPVVRIVLGAGWEMVAVLLGFTTLRAFFLVFTDVNTVLFSAKGQAKFQFQWSIFSLVLNTSVVLISVSYGLVVMVAARLALMVFLVPLHSWFAGRLVGLSVLDRYRVIVGPVVSACVMAAVVVVCDDLLAAGTGVFARSVTRVLLMIPMGAVIYILCELLIDRRRFMNTVQHLRAAVKRKRG